MKKSTRRKSRRDVSDVMSFESGVLTGLNAVENAVMLVNSPRCMFVRGLKIFLYHDFCSTVYRSKGLHRLVTAEWQGLEDVHGAEERLEKMLDRFAPAEKNWLFLFQNISSLASGFDLRGLGQRPGVVALDGPRLDEDFTGGYDEFLAGVLSEMLHAKGRRVELLLAGHLFSRNEADETANVAELNRLLGLAGVGETCILLGGGRLAREKIWPNRVVCLPYAGARSQKVLEARGLGFSMAPLPLGIEASAEWLKRTAGAVGREAPAEAVIERELAALIPRIQYAVTEQLAGRRALVCGDPALAHALRGFLREVAVEVAAAVVLSPGAMKVAGAASAPPTAEGFLGALRESRPDFVLGSGLFGYLAGNTPCIEIGLPSYLTHFLTPRPFLGFSGAARLVEDMLNARLRAPGSKKP